MSGGRTRNRGRAARHRERVGAPAPMLPPLELRLPYYEVLDEEDVERIHDASMRILEEIGIDFRDDEAIAYWKATRADVEGYRVRIDRALLMELVAKAPESFTLAARNPERSVPIGGRNMVFVPTYGSPFVLDFDNRRRYSTLEDLQAFHKLAHLSASMHLAGGIICEPVDVAVPKRHLHVVYSLLRHSDKPFMGATTARERAEDSVAMARIGVRRGLRGQQHRSDRSAELQLAAGLGRDDAGRAEGLCGEQPGGDRLSVRDGRCEHRGQHRRRGGSAQCRGARGGRVRPARAPGSADDLRPVSRHGGHAERGADGRNAGNQPDEFHGRPARAPLPSALEVERDDRAGSKLMDAPGRVRVEHDHAVRPALGVRTTSSTPRGGSKAG